MHPTLIIWWKLIISRLSKRHVLNMYTDVYNVYRINLWMGKLNEFVAFLQNAAPACTRNSFVKYNFQLREVIASASLQTLVFMGVCSYLCIRRVVVRNGLIWYQTIISGMRRYIIWWKLICRLSKCHSWTCTHRKPYGFNTFLQNAAPACTA